MLAIEIVFYNIYYNFKRVTVTFFIITWGQIFIQGCGFAFIADYGEDGILSHFYLLKSAFQKSVNWGQVCQNS